MGVSGISTMMQRELLRRFARSSAGRRRCRKALTVGRRCWEYRSLTSSVKDIRGPYGSYQEHVELAKTDPSAFWSEAADLISWDQKPSIILDQGSDNYPAHDYTWYSDGFLNTSYNCLDVHVVERLKGNQAAICYDSPMTQRKEEITYADLLDRVATLAGALQNELGVQAGDRVVIYMPMIPEAVVAMLACTRIGAAHSVVFGGFAAPELATRITECQPKVVISASAGIEPGNKVIPYKPLLDKALELADHSVERTVIVQRSDVQGCTLHPKLDVDYDELVARAQPVGPVSVPANHMHYLLYTSGTTSIPKGVVRDTGGGAVSLKYSMGAFYGLDPGDVMFTASDIGWVVGHSYIVYGPLLQGCTSILYEGKPVGTPDAGALWRIIEEYGVKAMFTAPTAFRAVKQADPHAEWAKKYDLTSLETIFLAGEHSDPDTLHWCEKALDEYSVPVVDHWWQTELGWPGLGNSVGLGRKPIKYGACAGPVPGFDVAVANDCGDLLPNNTLGNLIVKLPLPPGTLTGLYNDQDRFIGSYMAKYPGYYNAGDAALLDDDGYVYVMGRNDEIINIAGHRLSTGDMEERLMEHPEVADCAVVKMKDDLKGEVPLGFVIVNAGSEVDHDLLERELIQYVRETIGAIACFKKVGVVQKLPKTRSGKILRNTMSKIANGEPYKITPTVEDPNIFDYLVPEIEKVAAKDS